MDQENEIEKLHHLQAELEQEARSRRQQEELNSKLQDEYDVLLKKLAEAELHIDQLRLRANVDINKRFILSHQTQQSTTLHQKLETQYNPVATWTDTQGLSSNPTSTQASVGVSEDAQKSETSEHSGHQSEQSMNSDQKYVVGTSQHAPIYYNSYEDNCGGSLSPSILHFDHEEELISDNSSAEEDPSISRMSSGRINTQANVESRTLAQIFLIRSLQEQIANLKHKIQDNHSSADELSEDLGFILAEHNKLAEEIGLSCQKLDTESGATVRATKGKKTLEKELLSLAEQLKELDSILKSKSQDSGHYFNFQIGEQHTQRSNLMHNTSWLSLSSDGSIRSPNSPSLPSRYLAKEVSLKSTNTSTERALESNSSMSTIEGLEELEEDSRREGGWRHEQTSVLNDLTLKHITSDPNDQGKEKASNHPMDEIVTTPSLTVSGSKSKQDPKPKAVFRSRIPRRIRGSTSLPAVNHQHSPRTKTDSDFSGSELSPMDRAKISPKWEQEPGSSLPDPNSWKSSSGGSVPIRKQYSDQEGDLRLRIPKNIYQEKRNTSRDTNVSTNLDTGESLRIQEDLVQLSSEENSSPNDTQHHYSSEQRPTDGTNPVAMSLGVHRLPPARPVISTTTGSVTSNSSGRSLSSTSTRVASVMSTSAGMLGPSTVEPVLTTSSNLLSPVRSTGVGSGECGKEHFDDVRGQRTEQVNKSIVQHRTENVVQESIGEESVDMARKEMESDAPVLSVDSMEALKRDLVALREQIINESQSLVIQSQSSNSTHYQSLPTHNLGSSIHPGRLSMSPSDQPPISNILSSSLPPNENRVTTPVTTSMQGSPVPSQFATSSTPSSFSFNPSSLPHAITSSTFASPLHNSSAAFHGQSAFVSSPLHNSAASMPLHSSAAFNSPLHSQNASASSLLHNSAASTLPLHSSASSLHSQSVFASSPLHNSAASTLPLHTSAAFNSQSASASSLLHNSAASTLPLHSSASSLHSQSVFASSPLHNSAASTLPLHSSASSLHNQSVFASLPLHNSAASTNSPLHSSALFNSPLHSQNAFASSPLHNSVASTLPLHSSASSLHSQSVFASSPLHNSAASTLPLHTSAAFNSPLHSQSASASSLLHNSAASTLPLHSSASSLHSQSVFASSLLHNSAASTLPLHSSASSLHNQSVFASLPLHNSAASTNSPLHSSALFNSPLHSQNAFASSPLHNSAASTLPLHSSPLHSQFTSSPLHNSATSTLPLHNSAVLSSPLHSFTSSPLYNLAASTLSLHNSAALNSPLHNSTISSSPLHSSAAYSHSASSPLHNTAASTSPLHGSAAFNSPLQSHSAFAFSPLHNPTTSSSPLHGSANFGSPMHSSLASPHNSATFTSPLHSSSSACAQIPHSLAHISVHSTSSHPSSIHRALSHTSLHSVSSHSSSLQSALSHISSIHSCPGHTSSPFHTPPIINSSPAYISPVHSTSPSVLSLPIRTSDHQDVSAEASSNITPISDMKEAVPTPSTCVSPLHTARKQRNPSHSAKQKNRTFTSSLLSSSHGSALLNSTSLSPLRNFSPLPSKTPLLTNSSILSPGTKSRSSSISPLPSQDAASLLPRKFLTSPSLLGNTTPLLQSSSTSPAPLHDTSSLSSISISSKSQAESNITYSGTSSISSHSNFHLNESGSPKRSFDSISQESWCPSSISEDSRGKSLEGLKSGTIAGYSMSHSSALAPDQAHPVAGYSVATSSLPHTRTLSSGSDKKDSQGHQSRSSDEAGNGKPAKILKKGLGLTVQVDSSTNNSQSHDGDDNEPDISPRINRAKKEGSSLNQLPTSSYRFQPITPHIHTSHSTPSVPIVRSRPIHPRNFGPSTVRACSQPDIEHSNHSATHRKQSKKKRVRKLHQCHDASEDVDRGNENHFNISQNNRPLVTSTPIPRYNSDSILPSTTTKPKVEDRIKNIQKERHHTVRKVSASCDKFSPFNDGIHGHLLSKSSLPAASPHKEYYIYSYPKSASRRGKSHSNRKKKYHRSTRDSDPEEEEFLERERDSLSHSPSLSDTPSDIIHSHDHISSSHPQSKMFHRHHSQHHIPPGGTSGRPKIKLPEYNDHTTRDPLLVVNIHKTAKERENKRKRRPRASDTDPAYVVNHHQYSSDSETEVVDGIGSIDLKDAVQLARELRRRSEQMRGTLRMELGRHGLL